MRTTRNTRGIYAVMALILREYANEPVDLLRVIKMLLIHDIVEIDAGDTFAYDDAAHADKDEREKAAAERIFGMLPPDQGEELRSLWEEFERARRPRPGTPRPWTDSIHAPKLLLPRFHVASPPHHQRAGHQSKRLDPRGFGRLVALRPALIDQAEEKGYLDRKDRC